MNGFNVNADALDTYAGKLADNTSSVSDVIDLVNEADVSDESWGVVGLFVKNSYTEMLGDLRGLLADMTAGLRSASDKMSASAETYRAADRAHQETLKKILSELNSTSVTTIRA